MVLGCVATAQAQITSSQQNGNKIGEWFVDFNFCLLLSLSFCVKKCLSN